MNKKIQAIQQAFKSAIHRINIKNLKSKTFIRNIGFVFFIAILSICFLSQIWHTATAIVYAVGMTYLLVRVLFVKTQEEYLEDYKNMSKVKKKLIISKSINDLGSNFLSEIISVMGFGLTVYFANKHPSYDFIVAFILAFYFYWGFRIVQISKELMYLDFNTDEEEKLISKKRTSKFKKFNRRRQY